MHDIGVRSGSHQARAQRIFEHVRRAPCVLADHYFGFLADPGAVIPAKKTADLDRVIIVKNYIRFPAKSVCSKIFTQNSSLLISTVMAGIPALFMARITGRCAETASVTVFILLFPLSLTTRPPQQHPPNLSIAADLVNLPVPALTDLPSSIGAEKFYKTAPKLLP